MSEHLRDGVFKEASTGGQLPYDFSPVTPAASLMGHLSAERIFGSRAMDTARAQQQSTQRDGFNPNGFKLYNAVIKSKQLREYIIEDIGELNTFSEELQTATGSPALQSHSALHAATAPLLTGIARLRALYATNQPYHEAQAATVELAQTFDTLKIYVATEAKELQNQMRDCHKEMAKPRAQILAKLLQEHPCPEGTNLGEHKASLNTYIDTNVATYPELSAPAEKLQQIRQNIAHFEQIQKAVAKIGNKIGAIDNKFTKLDKTQADQQFLSLEKNDPDTGARSTSLDINIAALADWAEQFSTLKGNAGQYDDEQQFQRQVEDLKLQPWKKLYRAQEISLLDFARVASADDVRKSNLKDAWPNSDKRAAEELFDQTYDLVLLSYPHMKDPENWTYENSVKLREYIDGVYNNVARVVEKLAYDPKSNVDNDYNFFLPKQSAGEHKDLARELIWSTIFPGHRIEMMVGFGGTSDRMPTLRTAAYPLGGVQILSAINDVNQTAQNPAVRIHMPELRVFSAHIVSSAINNIDNHVAAENAQRIMNFVGDYIAQFYPDVANHVNVESLKTEDFHNDRTRPICEKVCEILANLYAECPKAFEEGLSDEEKSALLPEQRKLLQGLEQKNFSMADLGNAIQTMAERAFKHDNQKNPEDKDKNFAELDRPTKLAYLQRGMTYAGYHSMANLFGDFGDVDKILSERKVPATTVIKLGGEGERDFNLLQRAMIAAFEHADFGDKGKVYSRNGDHRDFYHLLKVGGRTPPYYATEGDVDLHQIHSMSKTMSPEEISQALLARQAAPGNYNDSPYEDLKFMALDMQKMGHGYSLTPAVKMALNHFDQHYRHLEMVQRSPEAQNDRWVNAPTMKIS